MTNKAELIQALRRKAESTTFQEEADAFFAKALELESQAARVARRQEQLLRYVRPLYTDTNTQEWTA